MKLLHLNGSDAGSTGKMVTQICEQASQLGWDCVSLFPKATRKPSETIREYPVCLPYEQGIYRRITHWTGLHYGFAPLSTARILRLLRKEKPDLVHLHSINCAMVNIYRLMAFLKKHRIHTVVTNHAEFFYTGNCPHAFDCDRWLTGCGSCPALFRASSSKWLDRTHTGWTKMGKAFRDFPNLAVVSVSPWVHSRSQKSPIMENVPQYTILNGVDTQVFHPAHQDKLRKQLGLAPSTKIILHVTANFSDSPTDSKGGRYLLQLAKTMGDCDVHFVVAGKHRVNQPVPGNMTLLGPVKDQPLLAQYYSEADLCVTVSQRETFGMTVAEALCCGTPVAGFVSGGSDSIALTQHTQFVPFGQVDDLESCIRHRWLYYKTSETAPKIATQAQAVYSGPVMARQYCDLYQTLTGGMKP